MTNEEKQALIEHAQSWIADAEAARDDIPFGFDEDTEMELSLIKIALAALATQPDDWQQRAEAAEAKLAELAKQEPVAWHIYQWRDSPKGWDWYLTKSFSSQPKIGDGWKSVPLFTRSASAINLAELVPDEMPTSYIYHGGNGAFNAGKEAGWNACRAAILRNIEEAK